MSNDMKLIMESWRKNVVNEQQEGVIVEQNAIELTKQYVKEKGGKPPPVNEAAGVIAGVIGYMLWLAGKFALGSAVTKVLAIISKSLGSEDFGNFFDWLSEGAKKISSALATLFVGKAAKIYINWRLPDGAQKDNALKSVDRLELYIGFIVMVGYFAFEISGKITEAGGSAKQYLTQLANKLGLGEGSVELIDAIEDTVDFVELASVGAKGADAPNRAGLVRDIIRGSQRVWQALFS